MRIDPISHRAAILLAMADLKDDVASLQICEMWLRMFPVEHDYSFQAMREKHAQ